jgi:serine/threonine protein kinase
LFSLDIQTFTVISIRDLLDGHDINDQIYKRMNQRFGIQVNTAVVTRDRQLMYNLYKQAEELPSTTTTQHIASQGFILDGDLFRSNDGIRVAFRKMDGRPFAMKMCTLSEFERAKLWLEKSSGKEVSKFIVEHIMEKFQDKYFLFMPLYPAILESCELVSAYSLRNFYFQMVDALECLHQFGFIHNDVKPSNILISTEGNYILADLGSLTPPNARSASTRAYVPDDMWDAQANRIIQLAAPSTDWWMLAMTLYEKGCGGNIGSGAREPTKNELIKLLRGINSTQLPREILSDLFEKLGVGDDNDGAAAAATNN